MEAAGVRVGERAGIGAFDGVIFAALLAEQLLTVGVDGALGAVQLDVHLALVLVVHRPHRVDQHGGAAGELDHGGGEVVHVERRSGAFGLPPAAFAGAERAELAVDGAGHRVHVEVAQDVERVVEHVHADVQEPAAARQCFAREPAADAGNARAPAPVGLAVIGPPDTSLRHQLAGALHLRREALIHAQHEVLVRPARRFDQGLRIGPAQRQRLLQNHVLARVQRLRRQRHMQIVGHRDIHRVHRVDGQQLLGALQHVRHAEPLAKRRPALGAGVGNRDQLRIRVLDQIPRPAAGHPAGPNDPKPNHALRYPPPRTTAYLPVVLTDCCPRR